MGGIAAARQANVETAACGALAFWHQPVFCVSAAFMPLVYFVTYTVLTDSRFSPEIQSMVVSTILSAACVR